MVHCHAFPIITLYPLLTIEELLLSTTRGYTEQLCGFWYNGDPYLTIVKMKRTNHDLQNTTQKLKIELHEPTKKEDRGELVCSIR